MKTPEEIARTIVGYHYADRDRSNLTLEKLIADAIKVRDRGWRIEMEFVKELRDKLAAGRGEGKV